MNNHTYILFFCSYLYVCTKVLKNRIQYYTEILQYTIQYYTEKPNTINCETSQETSG